MAPHSRATLQMLRRAHKRSDAWPERRRGARAGQDGSRESSATSSQLDVTTVAYSVPIQTSRIHLMVCVGIVLARSVALHRRSGGTLNDLPAAERELLQAMDET